MSIFGAEIIGTAILILMGNGVVAGVLLTRSKAQNSGWIVITFGWGMAVALAVYAVNTYSGAQINPAVTLGTAVIGNTDWEDVPAYLGGQFIGAFIGATLVWLAYYAHWGETEDPDAKLSCFSTIPAIRNTVANVATEVIGTFILVFVVLALGAYKPLTDGGLTPLLVGLLVLAIGLSLGGPTGYAINPARDLGPRIMHAILPIPGKGGSDWSYAWIPVVAPIVGGILGALAFDWFYPV
ncbi:MAG TPA: MIP/aquaporin family protein [Baekduia sp.]|nr:MIP/aquaporin family protein [Baekduia sp.]